MHWQDYFSGLSLHVMCCMHLLVLNTYLLVQRMGASHRVQLTGLDKFLTHQTQFTGGWSLWDKKTGHS